jgi:hypothetical protein
MSNYIERQINIDADTRDANKRLQDLVSTLDEMKGGLDKANKTSTETLNSIERNSQKAEKGISGISKGINKISTTIKASAIGLFIVLLTQVQDIFKSSQPVVDGYNTTLNFLKVSFTNLTGSIKGAKEENKSFTEELKDYASNGLKNAITGSSNLFKGLKAIVSGNFAEGFDKITESVKNGTDAILGSTGATQKLIDEAKRLTQLQKEFDRFALTQERLAVTYETQAEQQRQIRDNTDIDINRRIEANERLGRILEEQGNAEKKVLTDKIANLREQEQLLGVSNERTNELFALNTSLLAVENKITGQRSEQKTNATALAKELREIDRVQKNTANELDRINSSTKVALTADEISKLRLEINGLLDDKIKANEELVSIYNRDIDAINRNLKLQKEWAKDPTQPKPTLELPPNNTIEVQTRIAELTTLSAQLDSQIEILNQKMEGTTISQSQRALELVVSNTRDGFQVRLDALNKLQEIAEMENNMLFESEVAKNEYLQELSNERIAIEQAEADFKNEIQNQYLDSVSTGFRVLRGEFEKSKDVQAGLIIAESSVGVARTIINTVAGNQRAVAELGAIASIPFVASNTIAGTVGIAENILSTRKALQSLNRGGSLNSSGGGTSAPANFNIVESSGNNQLASQIAQQQNQPVQAFVVGSAVTSQQALDRNILQNSTFL